MSLGASSQRSRSQTEKFGFDFSQGQAQQRSFLNQQQLGNQQALVDRFMDFTEDRYSMTDGNPAIWAQAQNQRNLFQQQQQGFRQQIGNLQQFNQQAAGRSRAFGGALQSGINNLQKFARNNNPYIGSQLQQFAQQVGQNFREQILPGIESDAALAGQRGSSRQGIAEGIAARGAQDAIAREGANLQANAYNQRANAAQALGALGTQGTLGTFQQRLAGLGQQGAARGAQAQLLGQQQNYLTNFNQQILQNQLGRFTPFQIGAQIIGAPSVLQSGSSFDQSFGLDTAQSFSSGKGGGLSIGLI